MNSIQPFKHQTEGLSGVVFGRVQVNNGRLTIGIQRSDKTFTQKEIEAYFNVHRLVSVHVRQIQKYQLHNFFKQKLADFKKKIN